MNRDRTSNMVSEAALLSADDLRRFMGRWYVVHSTLKMWRTGGRHNPAITYSNLTDGAPWRWDDLVEYQEPGFFSKALKVP